MERILVAYTLYVFLVLQYMFVLSVFLAVCIVPFAFHFIFLGT